MEIKKYLKPYIECTKVETEYALLAGGSGGAGGGGFTPGTPGGGGGGPFNPGTPGVGGGHHAKTNPFDYEDDQDENENDEN